MYLYCSYIYIYILVDVGVNINRNTTRVYMYTMYTCMYQTNFKYTALCSYYSIIGQLERLKREAADVQKKVEETDVVMSEVETVSQQYLPLSAACSSMYFTLESLNQVSMQY